MDKTFYHKKIKQLLVLFSFGLLGGCIYLNLLWRFCGPVFQNEWMMRINLFWEYSVSDIFHVVQSYAVEIFIIHVAICVLGNLKIGKIILEGFILSSGFLAGAMETLVMLSGEIRAGILFLLKLIVVMSVYILLLGAALLFACSMSSLKWASRERMQRKRYLLLSIGTVIFHVVYIWINSYVNYEKNFL